MSTATEQPTHHAGAEPDGEALLFHGHDMARLHAAVTAEFAPHRLHVTGRERSGPGSFLRISRGPVAVYELGYGVDVEVVPGELPDFYNVHLPLTGTGTVIVGGRELASPLSIVSPGEHLSMRWSHDSNTRILTVSRTALDRALATRLGDPPHRAARFAPVLDPRAAPIRAWTATVHTFCTAARGGLLARSPLAREHLEQALLHGLLDAQPHTVERTLRHAAPLSSAAIRRAVTFCAEHAHEPVSVADIAQAARVSVRALRNGFRTQLGTTPLAHLRRVRLEYAHHDLLAVARGERTETVTDVALRWGFTHLGRFAQDHREAYGTTPSRLVAAARA
ncbi:AraC family transcriptional regulator [Streptomyces sp. NRRL WC-3742]|uniref:AraC family transcriptional regulator n=1 Tax=Streptomyces sp. NRRL WC-3742 TaxID=1463934 RepID=UPI00068CC3A4|nr:AraC family transcriptional regulator [Streptomyces sp. NRRL WC-3742]